MLVRFPRPLQPGDLVGVTSPSSGVPDALRPRLEVALTTVRAHGFEVEVGECMDGRGHVSATVEQRAAELQRMLVDPRIRAVVPPWGGETAIDLLANLDWAEISQAQPTWVVGFSDTATLITPLTLLTGWATVHGNNLMDTPYAPPEGLLSWLDIVTLDLKSTCTQTSPRAWREGFVDYVEHPAVDHLELNQPGGWRRLDGDRDREVDVTGRLIGGCLETLSPLGGSRYLDPTWLADAPGDERGGGGLIVYVEAAEADAFQVCRSLHGLRLAGFFDRAAAVLVGRTSAPDADTLTQEEAVLDALGTLGVLILADVECGHVAPYLPLVNGAIARVQHSPEASTISQTLA
ncbi:S66 family peptidase [Ornithinimicrobium sp. Y1694]|uniref:S66 family peptidase n=1 Tax=Ornithinimicrobium sp. Y1694 TaxID=3418590 RepID=UPI003CE90877